VRIISPSVLPLDLETAEIRKKDVVTFTGCCATEHQVKIVKFKKLIIHIHGGGFIAMSSDSHQSYTREWAK
jgi:hypothetical protein